MGTPIRLSVYFSAETLQARREQDGSLSKSQKRKTCQPTILYLAKISFKNEEEIKTFPDKQKLSEFINRLALQKVLKRVLPIGTKIC